MNAKRMLFLFGCFLAGAISNLDTSLLAGWIWPGAQHYLYGYQAISVAGTVVLGYSICAGFANGKGEPNNGVFYFAFGLASFILTLVAFAYVCVFYTRSIYRFFFIRIGKKATR